MLVLTHIIANFSSMRPEKIGEDVAFRPCTCETFIPDDIVAIESLDRRIP